MRKTGKHFKRVDDAQLLAVLMKFYVLGNYSVQNDEVFSDWVILTFMERKQLKV